LQLKPDHVITTAPANQRDNLTCIKNYQQFHAMYKKRVISFIAFELTNFLIAAINAIKNKSLKCFN